MEYGVRTVSYLRALNTLKVLTKFKRNFTPPDATNIPDVNIY